ncbi:MAG TPA: GntR family transcriptional regulator [Xanthobacteraceae bacterium]|jgi:DNA-binding GntR family transcriptional regulator|nr:GntR family transcriptional regulator [Xanthobacteraceae bacterium]
MKSQAAEVQTNSSSRGRPAETQGGRTLRQKAYEEIKRRIITMEYRPGEYLNEARISKQLRAGRTPVHQALHRLQLEQLVDIIPRKGVIVRAVSLDEIMNVTHVRSVNEALCVSLAARWADKRDIASLRNILDRAEEMIPAHDIEALMNLDHEFHCEISRISRNPVLGNILRSLHERSLRVWFLSLSVVRRLEDVHAEHEAIFAAIAAHDEKRAAQAARAHIEQFQKHIVLAV